MSCDDIGNGSGMTDDATAVVAAAAPAVWILRAERPPPPGVIATYGDGVDDDDDVDAFGLYNEWAAATEARAAAAAALSAACSFELCSMIGEENGALAADAGAGEAKCCGYWGCDCCCCC